MGFFGFLGNIAAGIQGNKMGKTQMSLGQQMIDQAQNLSATYQRPDMQTPEAIQQMADLAQGRMYQQMPGMTQYQNQSNQATAAALNSLSSLGSGSEAYGAVANLYANQMNQNRNLAGQQAQYQNAAASDYMNVLNSLGNWQQQAWQWNEADPYIQAQQKAAQLEMLGRQGQWEGLKNKMGSWAETFQGAGSALDSIAGQAASALGTGGASSVLSVLGG